MTGWEILDMCLKEETAAARENRKPHTITLFKDDTDAVCEILDAIYFTPPPSGKCGPSFLQENDHIYGVPVVVLKQ